MTRTQIRGSQIQDGTITSDDLADHVTFNSIVVSGSLEVSGSTVMDGSLEIIGDSSMAFEITGSFSMTGGDFIIDDVGSLTLTGSLLVTGEISLSSGSNVPMGTFHLSGSTAVTIPNSLVSSRSVIFLTKQTAIYPEGTAVISEKSEGSFAVKSSVGGDSDVVAYLIINPA